ncbi:hypothetical protein SAMN05216328_13648 [Ensifer sp. YR511]|nr:hypothetical protein SAMN05216328_13648 [Ensifer sp. YR511]
MSFCVRQRFVRWSWDIFALLTMVLISVCERPADRRAKIDGIVADPALELLVGDRSIGSSTARC